MLRIKRCSGLIWSLLFLTLFRVYLAPLWTTVTGSMWRECIRKKKEKDPMFHEHWQQLRSKSNSPPSKSFSEGESSAAQTSIRAARGYLYSRLILAPPPPPYHWLYSPPVDVVSSIALWKGLLLAFGRFVRSFYERRFSL